VVRTFVPMYDDGYDPKNRLENTPMFLCFLSSRRGTHSIASSVLKRH